MAARPLGAGPPRGPVPSRPLAHRRGRRDRPVRGQPLADAAARAADRRSTSSPSSRGSSSRWRFVLACIAAALIPAVLVYLELPLRGGLIPGLEASLVYGTPDTWDGFKYVALGEQFRGGISDPFGELPRKVADLADLATRELGPLAFLVAIGFLVTAIRLPPYALLTGSALLITCFFNAAYINADIDRYYLGPALIAWTWLAVLAGAPWTWR